MSSGHGPQLAFSEELHSRKYRARGEDFRAGANRIAGALKDSDEHFHQFRDVYLDMRFMPGGRVQAAAGSPRRVTAHNCFVSGTIHDSFVHGGPAHDEETHGWQASIMGRAVEAATTMRMGGGIGYDFSTLRPRGDWITGLDSRSCGPLGFMPVYDAVGLATSSTDHRRGAQMGVLRIDHPDIAAFVTAKQTPGALMGFNLSIAVTDAFMEAKASGRPFPLTWQGRTYSEIDPLALWEMVMRSTWDHAEPGVLFIDRINRMNNLWYCEEIAATNPCGEQPLPPYGACLLGSFNLARYMRSSAEGHWYLDADLLRADTPVVVRAMDNVVDRSIYPLERQELEARRKRRMGLGVTGLANAGEARGFPYGGARFVEFEREALRIIKEEAYRASVQLAVEKGPFPLFDAERYLQGRFVRDLPDDVLDGIRRHGIRNSHLTSIAPTGTISLAADNVSSGLEPVFSYQVERTEMQFDRPVKHIIPDYGVRVFGVRGKRCEDVAAQEHIDVLATAQGEVDSACSKTCNVSPDMAWDDFKGLYDQAFERGCKGMTTFNPGGKRMGILKTLDREEEPAAEELISADSCTIDLDTGRRSCE